VEFRLLSSLSQQPVLPEEVEQRLELWLSLLVVSLPFLRTDELRWHLIVARRRMLVRLARAVLGLLVSMAPHVSVLTIEEKEA